MDFSREGNDRGRGGGPSSPMDQSTMRPPRGRKTCPYTVAWKPREIRRRLVVEQMPRFPSAAPSAVPVVGQMVNAQRIRHGPVRQVVVRAVTHGAAATGVEWEWREPVKGTPPGPGEPQTSVG